MVFIVLLLLAIVAWSSISTDLTEKEAMYLEVKQRMEAARDPTKTGKYGPVVDPFVLTMKVLVDLELANDDPTGLTRLRKALTGPSYVDFWAFKQGMADATHKRGVLPRVTFNTTLEPFHGSPTYPDYLEKANQVHEVWLLVVWSLLGDRRVVCHNT